MTYVPGEGPLGARIAFVGEAPGAAEDELGRPFMGASGKELNALLASVGLSRQSVYITNVVKYRPPNNDFEVFYVDGKRRNQPSNYLLQAITSLHEELRRLKPNVIVPLGGEALRAITNRRSIDSWRGSILSTPLGKVIPTYHPAYILRQYGDRPLLELDLRRIVCESTSPHVDLPRLDLEVDPTFHRVLDFLRSRPRRVAVDIETSGSHVRCIGLADTPRHAICIPFCSKPGTVTLDSNQSPFPLASADPNSKWSLNEELTILQHLYAFLADPHIEKVLQNFPFDSTILSREFGLHISNLHQDTLVAQHTCHPELPKGLDDQASIYTRIPYWCDYDASSDIETWRYNCIDCVVTHEISLVHDEQMQRLGVSEFYHNHIQPAMLALTRAQNRGIRVDEALRGGMAVAAQAELERSKNEINKLTGLDLNPNSSTQMRDFLYNKLGMEKQWKKDKNKENRLTCDENALTTLIRKYPQHRDLLQFCLNYRGDVKLIGTYLTGTLLHGKIYTSYNVAGTVTGRINSSTPIINPEAGGNLQQVPRGTFRTVFISDPGWVLIKSDLGQADFRAVMWIARVHRLITKLRDPSFDVHRWNAAVNILSKPESEVTSAERLISKISIHGSNYGMGPDKAAAQRDFQGFLKQYPNPVQVCAAFQSRYLRAIPEITQSYWPETQHELQQNNRVLWTPFGRRRQFHGRWDNDLYRRAYAHRPQAVVGDIINRAFALGDEIFDPQFIYPLLQVHDEIVWHCRRDAVGYYLPLIRNLMEYPVMFHGVDTPMIIPAEITVGENWAGYDEVKNPEGQRPSAQWLLEEAKPHG